MPRVYSNTFQVSVSASVGGVWFANQTTNTWASIATAAGTRLQDRYPSPLPSTGLSGENPRSIVGAWVNGVVDQSRKAYLLCANGGHADYPGNETYEIVLTDATPRWRRLSDPTPNGSMPQSPPVFNEGGGLYNDGRPRAMHNCFACYGDGRVWMPFMNSVTSGGGGSVNRVVSWSRSGLGTVTTDTPSAGSPGAYQSGSLGLWNDYGTPASINSNVALFGNGVFDPVTHRAYGLSGNSAGAPHWWYVNTTGASTGSVSAFNGGSNAALGNWMSWAVCAYDLGIIVAAGTTLTNSIQSLTVLNIATNTWSVISNISGTGLLDADAGAVYQASNRSILVYQVGAGSTLRKLQIPTSGGAYNPSGTWTWSTINTGSGAPAPSTGKMRTLFNIVEDLGPNGEDALVHIGLEGSSGNEVPSAFRVYKCPAAGL